MNDPRDAFDRVEDVLHDQLASGELSQDEFNAAMRELGREYAEMADEAAREAYENERSRW